MLSVLLQEMPDAMKAIAEHYFADGPTLDVSFGNGKLTSLLPNVVGLDLDPGSPARIHADSSEHIPLADSYAANAIFDPPYLYGRESKSLHARPHGDWKAQHSRNDSPAAFIARAEGTARELFRVVRDFGVVVVKVADSRLDGRLIRNGRLVEEAFEAVGFDLIDVLVYVRLGTGVFKTTATQSAHGYFVVFRRPASQLQEAAA